MTRGALGRIVQHNNWANAALIRACASLTDEQLEATPRSPRERTIRQILTHLVESQVGYASMLSPGPTLGADLGSSLEDLARAADDSGRGLQAVGLAEVDLLRGGRRPWAPPRIGFRRLWPEARGSARTSYSSKRLLGCRRDARRVRGVADSRFGHHAVFTQPRVPREPPRFSTYDARGGTRMNLVKRLGCAAFLAAIGSVGEVGLADEGRPAITVENAGRLKVSARLTGHDGSVYALAFSPDSRRLASAGRDGVIRLWDVEKGTLTTALAGHKESVYGLAFDAGGKTLWSAGTDHVVRSWNLGTGKEAERQAREGCLQLDAMSRCAISPAAGLLAFTSEFEKRFSIWDLKAKSQREVPAPEGRADRRYAGIAAASDGRSFAVQMSSDSGTEIGLWDVAASRWTSSFRGARGTDVKGDGIALRSDGRLLASVDTRTRSILVWDVKSGEVLHVLEGHRRDPPFSEDTMGEGWSVSGLAFAPDGLLLASASFDGSVRFWAAEAGRALGSVSTDPAGAGRVAFSPDRTRVAASDLDGTVLLLSVQD